MDYLSTGLFVGIGATLITDLWGLLRKPLFGVPMPDYGLVGRWFAHMSTGQFQHERIASAPKVRGEGAIGWTAHYLIGVAFALLLLIFCGIDWAQDPTLLPALIFGIATVAAPFLLMQPGMGAGLAASRTPRPNAARLQSLITHTIFGLGLYVSAFTLNLITGT